MHVSLGVIFCPSCCLRFLHVSPHPITVTSSSIQVNMWTIQTHLFIARFLCPSLWQDFFLPSSFAPSFYSSLSPSLSHGCFQTDPRPMCTRCPPPLPLQPSTPSHSLSPLTPLFDTDRWNCYQYWLLCLSLCLPHSTLSILSSSFLSLTKWKISRGRGRENEWKRDGEGERDAGFAANIWAKAQGFPKRHSQ